MENSEIGEAFISPIDVYFEELYSAVQPDLIFVSKANMGIMNDDGYFYGAPDLIVEVLSSDKKRDTVKKKSLYERAGVKKYFIADPANRKVLCYLLNNSKYDLVYEDEGIFKSQLLNLEFSF